MSNTETSSAQDASQPRYSTLTVEAARQGWIVKEVGRPAEIFVRWESVVNYLQSRLTSK